MRIPVAPAPTVGTPAYFSRPSQSDEGQNFSGGLAVIDVAATPAWKSVRKVDVPSVLVYTIRNHRASVGRTH